MGEAQRRSYAKQKAIRDAVKQLEKDDPQLWVTLQNKVAAEKQALLVAEQRGREEALEREQSRLRRQLSERRWKTALVPTGLMLPALDESITGAVSFRAWDVRGSGYLHGIGNGSGYDWKEVNIADHVPEGHNTSGLYSVRLDPLSLMHKAGDYQREFSGLIESRGKVVEHEDGVLRSEWARILCIWVTQVGLGVYDVVPDLLRRYPNVPLFVCSPKRVAEALFMVTMRRFGGE